MVILWLCILLFLYLKFLTNERLGIVIKWEEREMENDDKRGENGGLNIYHDHQTHNMAA